MLIEERNPFWDDLAVTMLGFEPMASATTPSFPRKRESTVAKQEADVPPSMDSRLCGNDGEYRA